MYIRTFYREMSFEIGPDCQKLDFKNVSHPLFFIYIYIYYTVSVFMYALCQICTGTCFIHGPPLLFISKAGPCTCMKQVPMQIGWNCPVVQENRIFKESSMFLQFLDYIPLEMRITLHLNFLIEIAFLVYNFLSLVLLLWLFPFSKNVWTNLHLLYPIMLWAKFGWNWSRSERLTD